MALKGYRKDLDKIDKKIVKLLAQRINVAKKIGAYKHAHDMEIFQSGREDEIKARLEKLADKYKVRAGFLTSLWNHIMSEAIKTQEDVFEELDKKK